MMVATVLLAGGNGNRFGGRKQFAECARRSLLDWALRTAWGVSDLVVVVVPAGHQIFYQPGKRWHRPSFVQGGETRSESVRAGLAAIPHVVDVIVVHDVARPCATDDLYRRVILAVTAGAECAIPTVDVVDSIRGPHGPVDRTGLLHVQTPQAFRADTLRAAHADSRDGTDDASLVENVTLINGEPANLKITRPGDLEIADAILRSR